MKLLLKISLFIFLILFVISCTKDNTTNPQSTESMEDYMPLTIGSWWKYEQYYIDEYGTKYNEITYTLTIIGSSIVDGKQAFNIKYSTSNPDSTNSTCYWAIDNSKLMYYAPEMIERYGWLIEADLNSEKWILKDTIELFDSAGIKLESYEKWTIKKGSQSEFKIKDKTIPAIGFISEQLIAHNHFDDFNEKDTILTISTRWYGKGVGMIKRVGKLTWIPMQTQLNCEMVLIDYEIK